MKLFKDELHDDFGTWPLAATSATVDRISARSLRSPRPWETVTMRRFYSAWVATGDRLAAEARDVLAQGHRSSARELFLQASVAYAASYHPLFGAPVDPRLVSAFRKQIDVFDKGLALGDPPVLPLRIPLRGDVASGLFHSRRRAGATRRGRSSSEVDGYDATVTDLYFAVGRGRLAARLSLPDLRWAGAGRNALRARPAAAAGLGDGGAGGGGFRRVAADRRSGADRAQRRKPRRLPRPARGHGRAASRGLHRRSRPVERGRAARVFACNLGADLASSASLSTLDQGVLDRMFAIIQADRGLRWKIVQRGFWANGATDLRDFLRPHRGLHPRRPHRADQMPRAADACRERRSGLGNADRVRRPALPEEDHPLHGRRGAGDHCEMGNRSLLNLPRLRLARHGDRPGKTSWTVLLLRNSRQSFLSAGGCACRLEFLRLHALLWRRRSSPCSTSCSSAAAWCCSAC